MTSAVDWYIEGLIDRVFVHDFDWYYHSCNSQLHHIPSSKPELEFYESWKSIFRLARRHQCVKSGSRFSLGSDVPKDTFQLLKWVEALETLENFDGRGLDPATSRVRNTELESLKERIRRSLVVGFPVSWKSAMEMKEELQEELRKRLLDEMSKDFQKELPKELRKRLQKRLQKVLEEELLSRIGMSQSDWDTMNQFLSKTPSVADKVNNTSRKANSAVISDDDTGTQRLKRVLPMIINGSRYSATPDTGSLENAISADEARRLGLKVTGKGRQFVMGNGCKTTSLGTVHLRCAFALGNPQKTRQSFNVIANLAVPFIIGKTFLDISKTLTLHKHRLESLWTAAKNAFRVMHLNRPRQLMRCYVDGKLLFANPDTGSEMDLMSPSYALSNSWDIEGLDKGEQWVELADGTVAELSGKVRASFNVYDEIGGLSTDRKRHERTFYLMEGLSSDILLGGETLFDMDAFTMHRTSFIDFSDHEECSGLNLITWFERRERQVADALGVLSSAKTTHMRETELRNVLNKLDARELHQRNLAKGKIERLPAADRPAEEAKEQRRRQAYDAGRTRLRQERNAASNPSNQCSVATSATANTFA